MDFSPAQNAVIERLFAYSLRRTARMKKRKLKFAHYTSAEVGAQILLKKNVWMRNASSMNDYSEIAFGTECMTAALTKFGDRFNAALNVVQAGLAESVRQWLADSALIHYQHTYLTALCEHRPTDEMGLLSMWRAYGGPAAGVALIFENTFLDFDTNALAAWSSPVIYGAESFLSEFEKVVVSLEENRAVLQAVEVDFLRGVAFNALQFAILSTKHPGFREEREWRVIHSPRAFASAFVVPSFEGVRGKPEVVYHLPLQNLPGMNLPEIELSNLLHRVIIGPCDNPYQVASTFEDILRNHLGIADAQQRIRISGIPLRQR